MFSYKKLTFRKQLPGIASAALMFFSIPQQANADTFHFKFVASGGASNGTITGTFETSDGHVGQLSGAFNRTSVNSLSSPARISNIDLTVANVKTGPVASNNRFTKSKFKGIYFQSSSQLNFANNLANEAGLVAFSFEKAPNGYYSTNHAPTQGGTLKSLKSGGGLTQLNLTCLGLVNANGFSPCQPDPNPAPAYSPPPPPPPPPPQASEPDPVGEPVKLPPRRAFGGESGLVVSRAPPPAAPFRMSRARPSVATAAAQPRTERASRVRSAALQIDNAPAIQELFILAELASEIIPEVVEQNIPAATNTAAPAVIQSGGRRTRSAVRTRTSRGVRGGAGTRTTSLSNGDRGMNAGDSLLSEDHVWLKASANFHDQDDREGISGYNGKSTGFVGGADTYVSPNLQLGIGISYGDTEISGNTKLNKAEISSYQLLGYGAYTLGDRVSINFQADAGWSEAEGKRFVFAPVIGRADSNFDSVSFHVGAGITKAYDVAPRTQVAPSISIDFTEIRTESHTETTQQAALTPLLNRVGEDTSNALELSLGVNVSHQFGARTKLDVDVGVTYDVNNERATTTSSFVGGGGTFVTNGIRVDPWVKRAGLGLTHTLPIGAELTARYDTDMRTKFQDQAVSLKVRWAF